jgi:hypothetical protein
MNDTSNYESKINELMEDWNKRIDEGLKNAELGIGSKESISEINDLIAAREAVRRGLYRIDDEGNVCMSCPADNEKNESDSESFLTSSFDVTKSPRTKYGSEE